MPRYRKIDPRIWNDEKFRSFDPLEKLVWMALLTHPLMTPMGAGVIPLGILEEIIGNARHFCWRCNDICDEHGAETILEGFGEGSLIGYREGLVVVRRYLLYNRPDNPNQLAGWIESCEELPRSELFTDLRDFLDGPEGRDARLPEWLFTGLLDPLASGERRTLKSKFFDRINGTRKPSPEPSPEPSPKGLDTPPPNQEQEQEQEQEEEKIQMAVQEAGLVPESGQEGQNRTCEAGPGAMAPEDTDSSGQGQGGPIASLTEDQAAEAGQRIQDEAPIEWPQRPSTVYLPSVDAMELVADQKAERPPDKPPDKSDRMPDKAFDEWYAVYPRKAKRQRAATAYGPSLRRLAKAKGLSLARAQSAMMDAVKEFADSPKGQGEFCPHPSTWLNGDCWADDRAEWNRGQARGRANEKPKTSSANLVESAMEILRNESE